MVQISLNACQLPCPQCSDRQYILQPPHRVQAVVKHQHLEEPHRQTQRVTFYPAPHLASLALPLFSEDLKTCLRPSLIQKPARSLQIHCERELQMGLRGRCSRNRNGRRWLHLNRWSRAVAASIDSVTQTSCILYLQRADSWSSTSATEGHLWVQATWRR